MPQSAGSLTEGIFRFFFSVQMEECLGLIIRCPKRGGGRLFVAPILQTLILPQAPVASNGRIGEIKFPADYSRRCH